MGEGPGGIGLVGGGEHGGGCRGRFASLGGVGAGAQSEPHLPE